MPLSCDGMLYVHTNASNLTSCIRHVVELVFERLHSTSQTKVLYINGKDADTLYNIVRESPLGGEESVLRRFIYERADDDKDLARHLGSIPTDESTNTVIVEGMLQIVDSALLHTYPEKNAILMELLMILRRMEVIDQKHKVILVDQTNAFVALQCDEVHEI